MPRQTNVSKQTKPLPEEKKSPDLIPMSPDAIAKLSEQIEARVRDQLKQEFEESKQDKEEQLSKSEKNLEAQIAAQEKTLKQRLSAMKKVPILIPEDSNNPDDVVPIGWNGIIYAVPRGRQFMVPEVIRDIWQESYTKTQAVNRRIRESVRKEIKVI